MPEVLFMPYHEELQSLVPRGFGPKEAPHHRREARASIRTSYAHTRFPCGRRLFSALDIQISHSTRPSIPVLDTKPGSHVLFDRSHIAPPLALTNTLYCDQTQHSACHLCRVSVRRLLCCSSASRNHKQELKTTAKRPQTSALQAPRIIVSLHQTHSGQSIVG